MTDTPSMTHLDFSIHEAPMSGVMLNLELPANMHESLGVPKPEKPMHITLMYLGKAAKITAEDAQIIEAATRLVCKRHEVLTGTVGAHLGSFPAGEDGVPHWASVDVDGLQELRADLKEEIIAAGFAYSDTYPDYNPHVTLGFAPEGAPGPADGCKPVAVELTRIDLAYGPDGQAAFAPSTTE